MKTIASCKTLILGASAFACGAAFRSPEEVLISEPGILLIPEFAKSLYPVELSSPCTTTGEDICRQLVKHRIAVNGKVHAPPLSDFFAALLLRRKSGILMNCQLVDLVRGDGIWDATVYGADGLNLVNAERVVDTTPLGWRDAGIDYIRGKTLCATLLGNLEKMPPANRMKCASIEKGAVPGELTLRVDLPADATWHEARIRLHDIWNIIRQTNSEVSLGGEASAMSYRYGVKKIRRILAPGIIWNPAAQYSDLITAFEEGLHANWND